MSKRRMQVLVRLKEGVLDVQGKTIEQSLLSSGLIGNEGGPHASKIRVGKVIELDVEADTLDSARALVSNLCERVLVNPVIETFEIKEV